MSSISFSKGDHYDPDQSSPFFSRSVHEGSLADDYAFYFDTSDDSDGIPTLVNVTTGASFAKDYLNGTDFSYYLNFSNHTGHLTLNGGANGDVIIGGRNADHLLGDDGDDHLDGGKGADLMEGGNGNDTFAVDNARDVILEAKGGGSDTVNTTVSYALKAGQEIELLNALSAKAVALTGNEFGQYIFGDAGSDTLTGLGGADTLFGAGGGDRFVFKALSDSTVAASGRDVIVDFDCTTGDRIDLRGIDANTLARGDQSFCFIGNDAFSKMAGELQAKFVGHDTLLSGDVDGNGKADFAILLKGHVTLDSGDFLL